MRQEFSNERGNDPRIWIKNLSGWKLTGNRTPTYAMTGPNALSIKLVEPTGEQAIVRSWYIRWWTWLSYLYRQFKILAISYFSVQIISTIGWLALKIERCVRSSQTSGFDYRSSLIFLGSFSTVYVVCSTASIIFTFISSSVVQNMIYFTCFHSRVFLSVITSEWETMHLSLLIYRFGQG